MIFRVVKNKNFTVMSNYHFNDKNISLKAKGLLSLMLSLPEDWDYSINGLSKICKDGETAIRSAIKELEDNNYLERKRIYENGKIIDWDYIVYENPKDRGVDLVDENQQQGFQLQGFNAQLNTKKLNIEKESILSKDNTSPSAEMFSFGDYSEKPKKKNLYQKCADLINEWTNIDSINKLLFQYLDLCMEMKSIRGANQWKGMLNTLEKVQRQCHPHTFEEIIEMSIQYGWKTFYPINDNHKGISGKKFDEFIRNKVDTTKASNEPPKKSSKEF